jgi:ADP-dependent NAD(P)H-hydrate dehydratase / NAD(P)H-hydrate epimerase
MRESDALLSCTEAAHIDAVTREELGIPGLVLMENAGRAVWDAIRSRTSGPLVICAGPGNNGGDALVVARWAMMREDRDVQIITTRASLGEQATVQWKILEAMGATRRIWNDDHRGCRSALASEGWIVDGISGTGVAGALRGDAAQVVAAINESSAPVASIDVPSGARDGYNPGDPLVRADLTVVTGYRKRVLYIPAVRAAAGEIEQVDPGFPPTVLRRIAAAGSPPARLGDIYSVSPGVEPVTPDAHKGIRGRIGVIGGAPGTAGAPILTGLGALRGGGGMVRICSGATATGRDDSLSVEPALMITADDAGRREELLEWADVAVIGPGWTDSSVKDLLEIFRWAAELSTPLVCDAHALRLLSGENNPARRFLRDHPGFARSMILTPHPGELAALLDDDTGDDDTGRVCQDPGAVLETLGAEIQATTILKGSVTWIRASSGAVTVFDGRCPALGTAGSGDVLAGLLAALRCRTPDPGSAACAAVALHLRAARRTYADSGWFTATDLARAIGSEGIQSGG